MNARRAVVAAVIAALVGSRDAGADSLASDAYGVDPGKVAATLAVEEGQSPRSLIRDRGSPDAVAVTVDRGFVERVQLGLRVAYSRDSHNFSSDCEPNCRHLAFLSIGGRIRGGLLRIGDRRVQIGTEVSSDLLSPVSDVGRSGVYVRGSFLLSGRIAAHAIEIQPFGRGGYYLQYNLDTGHLPFSGPTAGLGVELAHATAGGPVLLAFVEGATHWYWRDEVDLVRRWMTETAFSGGAGFVF